MYWGRRLVILTTMKFPRLEASWAPMPLLRCSFRIDLALTLIAAVVLTGLGSGAARAQIAADPRSNVIVDLSVIDDDGFGPSSDAAGRRSGLAMPGSRPPVSRLHDPMPGSAPGPAPAPSLTPPTEPRSRMTLSPPRPEMRMVTTPRSLAIEVARAPRPVTAPSRAGALVEPVTTPFETPATMPPPLPEWTQPAGAPTVSAPIAEPASSESPGSEPVEATPMASTETASREPSPAEETPPPAPDVAQTPPAETAEVAPPPLPEPAIETAQAEPAAESLPPPLPETATARARPEDPAGRSPPPPPPPTAKTTDAPLPQPAAKAPPPPAATADTEQASLPPEGTLGAPGETLRIPFAAGETELAQSAQEQLDGLAQDLRSAETLRVQLLAYAGDEGASPSKARRVSLSRALAVRSYLIESGVKTSRIDVRALGNKTTSDSPDRVDVKVVER